MNVQPLINMNACEEAVEWAKTQPSAKVAWAKCERGDQMLWLLGKLSGPSESDSRKKLVLCACECARLALPLVPPTKSQPRIAVETAETWASGGSATLDDVRAASAAADAASASAAAAFAAASASAAADAASAFASADAADADARKGTLSKCADIVRKHYPQPPQLEGMQ